jgi:hypothetical protein
MTRPDLDSQYTESIDRLWPAIRAQPRSFFEGSPVHKPGGGGAALR